MDNFNFSGFWLTHSDGTVYEISRPALDATGQGLRRTRRPFLTPFRSWKMLKVCSIPPIRLSTD